MTLDEAIKHCNEVAEHNENLVNWGCNTESTTNDCKECAADHRQLAEWLTELKEAKRLLKAAVEDMRWMNENTQDSDGSCVMRTEHGCSDCPLDIHGDLFCKWKHEDEALKLIGDNNDEP